MIQVNVDGCERMPVQELQPFQRNLKSLSEESYAQLRDSIKAEGFVAPVFVWKNKILDGHQRLRVIEREGWEIDGGVPVVKIKAKDEQEAARRLLAIAGSYGRVDGEGLAEMAAYYKIDLLDMPQIDLPNFDMEQFLLDHYADPNELAGLTDEDDIPEIPDDPITQPGDLWLLGNHRVLCGDCTDREDVKKVLNGCKIDLLHADPPYGMGKEKEGIVNDNLYNDKLDAFLLDFWTITLPHMEENSSVYIWGKAENLWRLWYLGGLRDSTRLTFRNEIIWNKSSGQGMESDQHRMYPTASERCLFFMLGAQEMSENADEYWDGWEPVRLYLKEQREAMGWDVQTMKRIVGHSEISFDHWTSKSQWTFPTEDVYNKMREACRVDDTDWNQQCEDTQKEYSAFKKEYGEIKKEYSEIKKEYSEIKKEYLSKRAYFNNTHDKMTDVWDFPSVLGAERPDHPTPKPTPVLSRILKSSAPEDSITFDPFMGSGTTLIAAEKVERCCYGMEIEPKYCDVIVQRWEDYTGKEATLESTGATFKATSKEIVLAPAVNFN